MPQLAENEVLTPAEEELVEHLRLLGINGEPTDETDDTDFGVVEPSVHFDYTFENGDKVIFDKPVAEVVMLYNFLTFALLSHGMSAH